MVSGLHSRDAFNDMHKDEMCPMFSRLTGYKVIFVLQDMVHGRRSILDVHKKVDHFKEVDRLNRHGQRIKDLRDVLLTNMCRSSVNTSDH